MKGELEQMEGESWSRWSERVGVDGRERAEDGRTEPEQTEGESWSS